MLNKKMPKGKKISPQMRAKEENMKVRKIKNDYGILKVKISREYIYITAENGKKVFFPLYALSKKDRKKARKVLFADEEKANDYFQNVLLAAIASGFKFVGGKPAIETPIFRIRGIGKKGIIKAKKNIQQNNRAE